MAPIDLAHALLSGSLTGSIPPAPPGFPRSEAGMAMESRLARNRHTRTTPRVTSTPSMLWLSVWAPSGAAPSVRSSDSVSCRNVVGEALHNLRQGLAAGVEGHDAICNVEPG